MLKIFKRSYCPSKQFNCLDQMFKALPFRADASTQTITPNVLTRATPLFNQFSFFGHVLLWT